LSSAAHLLERLRADFAGCQKAAALAAAVEVGLLDRIRRGPATASSIARSCRSSTRGISILADALVGLGFFERRGARYGLARTWKPLFVVQGGGFARSLFLSTGRNLRSLADLAAAVRRGGVADDLDQPEKATAFFRDLVPALHEINREPARRAARALGLRRLRRPFRVLDVAAGSGIWGIAAAKASPLVRVDAFDLPGVLPVTRRFARAEGVEGRFRFLAGDLRKADFGRARYDLVLLGQICHSEGRARTGRLLRAVRGALVPGGRLAVAEFVVDEDRRGPIYASLFSLTMLVRTEHGEVFSLAGMRRLMRRAGFRDLRAISVPPTTTLLLARTPER